MRAVGSGHQTVKLGEFAFLSGNKLASGMNSWSHFQIKRPFNMMAVTFIPESRAFCDYHHFNFHKKMTV
ncbi:hypothetical protein EJQ95_09560 [Salmonella enterica]|nr:hypothetical protein [Salmonella enterica]